MIAHRIDHGLTIVFAGGGTGGHLYPALAIAGELAKLRPDARVVFFGTTRPVDQHIISRSPWELVPQRLSPLSPRPWRWPGMYGSFRRARLDCRERLRDMRPAVVVGTGGLASVPPILEALSAGIPTALFNPDAVPGRANKFLAKRVEAVFAQWNATRGHVPNAALEVTGCPVRREFLGVDRDAAIRAMDLDPARLTLLVTGASQGARTINEAAMANVDFLRQMTQWQILHLTGDADFERVRDAYATGGLDAMVKPYTHEMASAFAAADLIVSRAGASTLAEITAVGRASILMPYPHHRDQHQLANARCLADCGAAMILRDRVDLAQNSAALRAALENLMTDHQARQDMAGAAQRMGRPDAAATLARRLLELAGAPRGITNESLQGVVTGSR